MATKHISATMPMNSATNMNIERNPVSRDAVKNTKMATYPIFGP